MANTPFLSFKRPVIVTDSQTLKIEFEIILQDFADNAPVAPIGLIRTGVTAAVRVHVEDVMSKSVFAAALAAFALASSTATAADAVARYWQGPYVGVNLGYQWSGVSGTGANPSGVGGGAQVGHNWQFGQFVVGGETDFQFTDADDKFASWKFSNPWFGTLRARAGVTMSNLMFYGTVGLAYGSLKVESTSTSVTESHTSTGWTGGAGIEAALMGNWSARAEYLYVDLSDRSFVLTGTTHSLDSNILRVGVNYHF